MVNIYKLELTLLQQRIMRLLFVKSGMSLNMRRIANLLDVTQPAVMKAIPLLESKNYIRVSQEKESLRWSIEMNKENDLVVKLKRADNIKQIYESGLYSYLFDTFAGATIILFGSYSNGEDTINSDIDLAIIGSKEKDIDPKFEKILERKIVINHYKSLSNIDKYLLNNILNGITLKGAVEI